MSTDFSTIDRLVEFGMGIVLAQQMVNTMNHAMTNMKVPGINTSISDGFGLPLGEPTQWFVIINGSQLGPASDKEVSILVDKGLISEYTLFWRSGLSGWRMAKDIPEIFKILTIKH